MKKKLVAMFLAIVMIMSVMVVPASAATVNAYVNGTAVVTVNGKRGVSYVSYDTRSYADGHIITIYADDQNFPVTVKMRYNDSITSNTYTLNSYGTHRLRGVLSGSIRVWRTYLTIEIKPYPVSSTTSSSARTKQPTEEEILNEKLDQLLNELELPFVRPEYTPYGKELKAFLTGEWDGSWRCDENRDNYAGYIASRRVFNRTYRWLGTSLYTGKTFEREVNVDYIGYLEVIPGVSSSQDFSLAASRSKGLIEEWSLLEKRNSWQLKLTGETIDKILPLGDNGNECRAMVFTTDANGQQQMYSLLSGNKVEKLT